MCGIFVDASNGFCFVAARKRSLGEVLFSHVFVCSQVGGSLSGRHPLGQRLTPYGKERAVRILLECFLVLNMVLHELMILTNTKTYPGVIEIEILFLIH